MKPEEQLAEDYTEDYIKWLEKKIELLEQAVAKAKSEWEKEHEEYIGECDACETEASYYYCQSCHDNLRSNAIKKAQQDQLEKDLAWFETLMEKHMSHPSNKPCPFALEMNHIWVCWDYIYEIELSQKRKELNL